MVSLDYYILSSKFEFIILFRWIHTCIPIMSSQMMKYLQSFLPFLNGIHESLFHLAKPMLKGADDELFIVFTPKNKIKINSNLQNNQNKKL